MRSLVYNRSSSRDSSQNAFSKNETYEDNDIFEFIITEPDIAQPRKSNRSKVVVHKLVDQVKKLKRQVPRVGYQVKEHANSPISLEEHVDNCPNNTDFRYETKKEDLQYINNKRFFSRFKNYHLHLRPTTTTDEEENSSRMSKISFNNEGNAMNSPVVRFTKKRYFKRKKHLMLLAKFKPIEEMAHFSISSSSLSSTVTKARRKRRLITFTYAQKKSYRKRKPKLQQQQPQNDAVVSRRRHQALIRIRHQMLDFKIPAGWTCIGSKVNSSSSLGMAKLTFNSDSYQTLISGLIRNIQQLHQEIEIQTDIIKLNQLDIIRHQTELNKLDQDLGKLFQNGDGFKWKGMELSILKKGRYLLQEAYDQNKKLLKKNNHTTIKSFIRLQHLQIKVQSLHKTDLLWSHLRRWAFPFVAFFSVIAAINLFL